MANRHIDLHLVSDSTGETLQSLARATVARFQAEAGARLRLVHEPRPGISHARNTAVQTSRGRLLAFLDDEAQS
jgi:regulator of PEP synthase PpsR (kinase-PPPase family)